MAPKPKTPKKIKNEQNWKETKNDRFIVHKSDPTPVKYIKVDVSYQTKLTCLSFEGVIADVNVFRRKSCFGRILILEKILSRRS